MAHAPHPALLEKMITETALRPRSFAWFMENALYDPLGGYYGAGRAAIGREGDFLTSVGNGAAFPRLLLWQFAEMWEFLGSPPHFAVLEQGAHEGHFAAGILRAAREERPEFFEAMRYAILEPSPVWKARQMRTLEQWQEKVTWSAGVADTAPFTGVHFSNELLDAMPVRLVRWNGGDWKELFVTWDGNRFVAAEGDVRCKELAARLESLPRDLPVGYTTEVNLRMVDWIRDTAALLEKGYVLLADYGRDRASYYEPSRSEGTLRAFSGHRRFTRLEDILSLPGTRDITMDVEFTTLKEAAEETGLNFVGHTDQHHFLVGAGEPEFARLEASAQDMQGFLRSYQALTHPGTMGTAFQFLCFAKNAPGGLRGFKFS